MKANSKKGMACKGSMRKTIIILINNGISCYAGQKTTTTKIIFNPKRYTSNFDNKLNKYFPINKYGSREKQIEAYHYARFVNKQRDIIKAFGNC